MPMYTAASPGNLLPKFSAPADGATIARRASLLHTRTGVAEKETPLGVLPALEVVVAGAEPTNAVAPARTTKSPKPNLAFIVPPLQTRSPRPHEAARAEPRPVGGSRARRRIVLDPEDRRIGVRRNQCHIDRRRRTARVADLPRLVAVLDERGSVRRVRPVGGRVALRIDVRHFARLHRHEHEARVVMPAAVAAWLEGDRLHTNVGRTLCLELDPVAVQLNDLVEIGLSDERRNRACTDRSESHGRKRSDHGDTDDRRQETPRLPILAHELPPFHFA